MTSRLETLWALIGGYRGSAVASALVSTGIADALYVGEGHCDELADSLQLDRVRTLQLLRAAAAFDLVQQRSTGVFALSELGTGLASQAPESLAGTAVYFAEVSARALTHLGSSVRGGASAFERAYDQGFYEFLDGHPDVARAYNRLIAVDGLGQAIAQTRDFTKFRHVVDLGGGQGCTLAELLRAHSHLTGTVVDLPHAVRGVADLWAGDSVASRLTAVAGNFFDDVPAGGDLYLLCRVLPNLSDGQTLQVLERCAEKLPPGGHIMIVDMETPEQVTAGDFRCIGDLQAMAHFGGRIRTRSELSHVLGQIGFTLSAVHPLAGFSGLSVVEAVRNS